MAKLTEVLSRPEFQNKTIDLTAVTLIDSYEKKDTKESVDFVAVVLPDPFGDEDFTNIKIVPKWKNDLGLFKFYAKKALRTAPEIEFPGQIKVLSYKSKKTKKITRYFGIVGKSPFNDNREIEFEIRAEEDQAVFKDLCKKAFGITEVLEEEPEEADD